jgi:hypothetical protein
MLHSATAKPLGVPLSSEPVLLHPGSWVSKSLFQNVTTPFLWAGLRAAREIRLVVYLVAEFIV